MTTSSVDLLLQNGLEITSAGRCTRHPQVVVCSKKTGQISSCEICAAEQAQGQVLQEESLRSQLGGDDEGGVESELGVSLSKMVSGQSAGTPGAPNCSDNNGGINGNNGSRIQRTNTNSSEEYLDEDGADSMGSMEKLIARWCQLQDANSKPTNDMLSSTLILLQLQKLERRVQQQESSIRDLAAAMQQQQSAIQSDLTRILSFVAVAAKNSSHPSNGNRSNHNSSHHRYRSSSAPPQTLQVGTNHSYLSGSAVRTTAAASAVSALTGSAGTVSSQSNHGPQSQSQPKQVQEIVLSPQSNYQRTDTMSLHPSSVFTSVRTLERQPPRPPKRHDSFQSLSQSAGNKTPAVSVGEASTVSSAVLQPPTVFVPYVDEVATADMPKPEAVAANMTAVTSLSTNTVTTSATTAVTGNTSANGTTQNHNMSLTKSKSKSSFRNSTPQLDIIWDASEHTSGHSPSRDHSRSTATDSNSKSKGLNPKADLIFNPKGKRPTLAACLDDDDEDDDESGRSSKLFSAVKGYMDLGKYSPVDGPPQLAPINNHDSLLTDVQSFMDESYQTEETDTNSLSINDLEAHRAATKGGRILNAPPALAPPSIAETTDEEDDDDEDDDEEDDDQGDDVASSSKSGSNSKDKKKKKKKEKKKSWKKKSKKQGGSIINNKVSPSTSEEKEERKKPRFSTSKIFWKRSSRNVKSETNASLPQRQITANSTGSRTQPFSFVDDNPRSHQVPTADAPQPTNGRTFPRRSTIDTKNSTYTTRSSTYSFGGTEETMTSVKSPMTAKTPLTAKTPQDAILQEGNHSEPPPPPQPQKTRPNFRRDMNGPNIHHSAAEQGRQDAGSSHQQNQEHGNNPDSEPATPPPRRRAPFPRTRVMMPTLVNSKREIVIAGESSRMQISTLTLDTALPSADAGSVLQEVTGKSITDKCKERGTYTGTVNETEEPDGYGTMIYSSGAFYKGNWKEGHWHGHGILRTPNGDSYEGDFVYDCRHGRGIYKYENGDVYEGDFSSDKRHGKGTFLFQSGSMYRGDFAYGNFHGYGWYEFEEGYYEGSWVEGVYEGIGSLFYKDGSHYTGRFKGGVADGMGEEVKPDGTSKRGMWRNGDFLGQIDDENDEPNPHDSILSI